MFLLQMFITLAADYFRLKKTNKTLRGGVIDNNNIIGGVIDITKGI